MSTLRNLDLNLIKVFDAIYTARSVSGAARRMGVSQPSISRGLSRLREHFDDPLFERSGNGVAPTAKAEAMLDSVKSALSLLESTIEEGGFDPATDKRHFRMIIPDFVEAWAMPGILNALPPDCRLSFEAIGYAEITDFRTAIAKGEADVAIVPFLPEEADLSYRHIMDVGFVVIARKGHPVLKDGFAWTMLDRVRFVSLPGALNKVGRLDEALIKRGLKRDVAYVTSKLSAFAAIVSSTDLIAFAGRQFAGWLKRNWPIEGHDAPGLEVAKQDFYLVSSKQAHNDPAIIWLCDQIEAGCRPAAPEDEATP